MPLDINVRSRVFFKFKGTFSFDKMYFAIHDYLNSKSYDVVEPLFKDKDTSPYGHEIELKIRGTREVTEFVQYDLLVYAKVEDVKEFTVDVEGESVLMTQGRVLIRLEYAKAVFDYQDRFKGEFLKIIKWEKVLEWFITGPLLKYWEIKYVGAIVEHGDGVLSAVKNALDMEGN